MSAHRDHIGQAIAALVAVVTRHPVLTLLAVLGLTAAAMAYTVEAYRANEFGINTDTADMISPHLPWRQDYIAYRDSFPARDNNIVAVVDAATGTAALRYVEDLAAALAAEPALFPSVFLARHDEFFERNGLLYPSLEELERLEETLFAAQPLLGRLSADASGAGILDVLTESLDPTVTTSAAVEEDLDAIFAAFADTLDAANAGASRPVDWSGLIGFGAEAEPRQLLLIRPTLDFSRVRPAREAIERIRDIGRSLPGSDAVSLRLTGTLAMEHEELSSVTRSASVAGVAALIMVIIVLVVTLRSVLLLGIAVFSLLSGLVLTVAFAALTVGHLNLLSVAFAVLYVGLGVDFILHMTLRFKELRRAGSGHAAALVETARGVGTSLLICAITTAVGFFAFVPTDFDGISELGFIAGGGMFISLIVSLTLLPALLRLMPDAPLTHGAGTAGRAWLPRLARLPALPTCLVAGAITLLAVILLPGLRFDGNPIHLRDPHAESIQTLEDLADDSDAPLFDLVALVDDADTADAVAARLRGLDTVNAVTTIDSLVPDDQEEKLYLIEELNFALGSTLRAFDAAAAPPSGRITASLEKLVRALSAAARRTVTQDRFLGAADIWIAGLGSVDASTRADRAAALDRDIRGDLLDRISELRAGLGARAFDRDDLPASLRERWVNAAGQELVEIDPRENLNDNAAARRFVSSVREIVPNATGLPVVYEEAAATVTRSFELALTYAFAAVTVLLLVFLQSVKDTLLVLVPIVFAATVTAGISVLLGLPLNFANIIALPLLIGVGVDSGIHMVHRMRTEPPRDGDPLHTSTSRAVLASAVTTIASFGNLAFSSHVGMASMGQLLTLGMVTSVVAVLIVLPALMRLWRRV